MRKRSILQILQVYNMMYVAFSDFNMFKFFPPSFCHSTKVLLFLNPRISSATKISCDSCRTGTAKGVENPVTRGCRSKNDAGEHTQRLLCRMLSLRLFPSSDSRKSPYICHLLIAIEMFHQLVIELMWHSWQLPSPDNKFC